MGNDSDKVGDLTYGHLMHDLKLVLSGLLDQKLAQLATKDDFAGLTDKVNKLTAENESLKQEIITLKTHDKVTCDKLVDLESRSRRNNLIFKGLQFNDNTKDFKSVVLRFLDDVLGAGGKMYVNRAHRLGRGTAVIAHLPHDADIDYIMSQTHLLKGTGYVIHRDFPAEVRQKRSCLMTVRTELERVTGRKRFPIYFDHLLINNIRFTWEEGRLKAGQQDGGEKLKTLFGHDFSDFLATVGRTRLDRGQRQVEAMDTTTAATNAEHGERRGTASPKGATYAAAATGVTTAATTSQQSTGGANKQPSEATK